MILLLSGNCTQNILVQFDVTKKNVLKGNFQFLSQNLHPPHHVIIQSDNKTPA